MQDLMIDIESMGTRYDAPIISIAGIFFDLQTETIGMQFHKNVHLATAMRDGARPDAGAILFWMKQNETVRRAVTDNAIDIKDALREFALWVDMNCGIETVRPWGNSARFDLQIIDTACIAAHQPLPWKHKNERDYRTVKAMYPKVEALPKPADAHDPLVDCKYQIQHLFRIKQSRKQV